MKEICQFCKYYRYSYDGNLVCFGLPPQLKPNDTRHPDWHRPTVCPDDTCSLWKKKDLKQLVKENQ